MIDGTHVSASAEEGGLPSAALDALDATAAEARMMRFDAPGAVLAVGDLEILYTISSRDEVVVEKQDRGAAPRLEATADSLLVAVEYLRFVIHDGLRRTTAAGTGAPPPLPAGFSLDEHEPGALILKWTGRDSAHWLQLPDRIGARRTLVYFAMSTAEKT